MFPVIILYVSLNSFDLLIKLVNSLSISIASKKLNQPVIISEIYNIIGGVQGVQSVPKVSIENKTGFEKGYSQFKYDLDDATLKGIIYPSLDPSIFEIRYPNRDIKGRVIQY